MANGGLKDRGGRSQYATAVAWAAIGKNAREMGNVRETSRPIGERAKVAMNEDDKGRVRYAWRAGDTPVNGGGVEENERAMRGSVTRQCQQLSCLLRGYSISNVRAYTVDVSNEV